MKRTDITALFPDATDEQLDRIMSLNGADINKAKGDLEDVRTQLAAAQSKIASFENGGDLQEVTSKVAALQQELDKRDKAEAIRTMREKVSGEMKVPTALLTGETEEACAEQAKAILAFAQSSGYPVVRDGGDPHNQPSPKTRDKFAEWAKDNL